MKIVIYSSRFSDNRENTEFYLRQLRGLNFDVDGENFCVHGTSIDVISIDRLESYIYYLERLGKIRYGLIMDEYVFVPVHAYVAG